MPGEIETLREKYPDVAGELYTVNLVKGELGLGKKKLDLISWIMNQQYCVIRTTRPWPKIPMTICKNQVAKLAILLFSIFSYSILFFSVFSVFRDTISCIFVSSLCHVV